jgi:hypothetical protein
MARENGTAAKRTRTSGSRTRRPKTAQSVVTRVSPEAVERMVDALTRLVCAVDHPQLLRGRTERERGGEYIAAIAEQRPGVAGHGYPAGYPDWDQRFRLFWTGRLGKVGEWWTDIMDDRTRILPDWMSLPLVRQIMLDPQMYKRFVKEDAVIPDETGESESGKIDGA